jgi:hypothetical protein
MYGETSILEKLGAAAAITLIGGMMIFLFVVLFVALPLSLRAEAKCLDRGYPKAYVTWNLKEYCSNLEGSVTIRVEALQ